MDYVAGTKTNTQGALLSFASVSLRGEDVYRCRPEEGFGLCRHSPGRKPQTFEGCYPSIASPVLAGDKAVYGGLDGALYVVPLAGGKAWSFPTAFGKADLRAGRRLRRPDLLRLRGRLSLRAGARGQGAAADAGSRSCGRSAAR